MLNPDFLFPFFWVAWAVSWVAAAPWSSRAVRGPAWRDVWVYRLLIALGVVLSVGPISHRFSPRLWHVGREGGTFLAVLTLPGFAFAWWARIHLGRLWSGSVTRKQDHRVIDTGPYAIVRHPIYTGLLAACLVSAVAVGTAASLAGLAALAIGFWFKARLEERFLARELAPHAYDTYRRRVPMLLPLGLFGRAG